MLLAIDGTFLVQMVNFIIFWALLNFLFISPVRRSIAARQAYVAAQIADAAKFDEQARALRAQAEETLAHSRKRVEGLLRTAEAEADSEVSAIEKSTAERIDEIVRSAHSAVGEERTRAVARQGAFVDELARSMVDRALGLVGTA